MPDTFSNPNFIEKRNKGYKKQVFCTFEIVSNASRARSKTFLCQLLDIDLDLADYS